MDFEPLLLAHRRRRQSQTLFRNSDLDRGPHRQYLADFSRGAYAAKRSKTSIPPIRSLCGAITSAPS